jgi:rhamnose transport system permease protein
LILKGDAGLPAVLVFAIAIGVGATVGITNGLLVTYLRVPSIVLTLGMLYLVSGVTYIVAHGNQVNPYNVPSSFVSLSITSPIAGIPWIVIFAFVFAAVMAAVLRWTRDGRSLYALGSNPEAAQLRGLPARRLVIVTFVVSGAAAGLGGAMYLSQFGLVQIGAGSGLELQAITAAIVGGVSVFGGSGTILGTTAACILLGAITNGIAVLGYSPFLQDTVFGALLVIAVIANAMNRRFEFAHSLVRPELKS